LTVGSSYFYTAAAIRHEKKAEHLTQQKSGSLQTENRQKGDSIKLKVSINRKPKTEKKRKQEADSLE
jgi:hypothetical protein